MKKNCMKRLATALALLLCFGTSVKVSAQAVIFPQEQQAGTAVVSVSDNTYTLSNELFSAHFVLADGKLTFGGCEALGLVAGSEIFKVELQDGTEISASEFTLVGEVTTEALTGDPKAVKGAKRFNGQQIKAAFTHTNGLELEWRAVLRDGSHYLRTELDIKNAGTEGLAMSSITPMMYTVQNVEGQKAPAIVGNTRGAVIASDKIFAGLETPMGIQTAGTTTDLESFVFKAWSGATSWAWTPEEEDIPEGIKSLSQYASGTVNGSRGYVIFRNSGEQTITLAYTSGNNRLQILGLDILDLNGNVISSDYGFDYTTSNRPVVCNINIPSVGAYMVRIFVTSNGSGEGYGNVGTITYSAKVSQPTLVYDLASTETPYCDPEAVEAPESEVLPERVFTLQTGMTYYIAANTKQSSGSMVPRYLYINADGALATATEIPEDDTNYKWTLTANGDAWYVQNGGGKYLSYGKPLQSGDAAYSFKFTDEAVIDAYGAFALYNPTSDGGKYMVTKVDGSDFNQNSTAINDGSWCSDYLFTTCVTTVGTFDAENTSATDNWVSAWTGFNNWSGTLPSGTTATGTAKYKDTGFYSFGVGRLDVLFDYSSGSHGLYVLGVQIVDADGNIIAQDFKNGFTGNNPPTVTYNIYIPESGIYKVRYIADYRDGGTNTNGDITLTFTAYDSITGTTHPTKAWTSAWTGWAAWSEAPNDLKSYNNDTKTEEATSNVQYLDQMYYIKAGNLSVLYDYTSGGHGLFTLGVVLLDKNGNIVATDYHAGFTGGNDVKNTYSVKVTESGFYTVRFVVDKKDGGTDTNGTITLSVAESTVLGTIDEDTTLSDAWTSTKWFDPNDDIVPARVVEAGCLAANARMFEQQLTVASAGELSVEFLYASGNLRLDIAGVDILDENGDIIASDYHAGFTGSQKDANVYSFTVPQAGVYTLRYFVNGTGDSSGNITLTLKVDYNVHLIASETTPIAGKWSRITTLAAGETWNVGAVVGVIAPGQARRSFLAYSERERAVPWRAVPVYISWYEVNINHNNNAPGSEALNMTEADCLPIIEEWKEQLYDKYGEAPFAFVWDDGWDTYGPWEFHDGFPQGFTNMDNLGQQMGAGQGAWLGPVGGYGTSGTYRRNYWSSNGGMQLSNSAYYDVFLAATTGMINDYDFRFFKFDGISAQFSAVGPDAGATGQENAEAIISAERTMRSIKEDIFLNTTVGTWASPFWYQFTDATWRQENDYGTKGSNSVDRENWITYRDFLVYQNYVQNSPLCPINTLMTHGFILTGNPDDTSDTGRGGWTCSRNIEYKHVLNELRCAFACGSGMVELYNDYDLMNSIQDEAGNAGALWKDLAECMAWQRKNADVLPDIHWVGGNPATEVYGWAAWNAKNAVLTLRNGLNGEKTFTFTLREALDIPAYVNTSITLTKAFADQLALTGLTEGQAISIDDEITVTLPGSSVYVFDGLDGLAETEAITLPVTKYGIATFCADHETIIPAGAKAYVALNDPELPAEEGEMGVIIMTEITNVVPANTGVVVLAEEGNYDFYASSGNTAAVDGNLLQGYGGRAEYEVVLKSANTKNYVLTVKEIDGKDIAAFYWNNNNSFKVYRNRAYLKWENAEAAQTKGIRMKFENEDGTTEIRDVLMGNDNAAPIFDLSGRRVQTPQKGVYIVNGKKVIF